METTITPKLPAVFSPGFFKLYFKGIGQVMFQGNIWTGIFFLAGIFYGAYEAHMPAVAWGVDPYRLFTEISGGKRIGRPLGIQRYSRRMRPPYLYRKRTFNVAGYRDFFFHDDLGNGGSESFVSPL